MPAYSKMIAGTETNSLPIEELNDGKIVILLAPRGIAPKPCPRCAGPSHASRWGSFRALITPQVLSARSPLLSVYQADPIACATLVIKLEAATAKIAMRSESTSSFTMITP